MPQFLRAMIEQREGDTPASPLRFIASTPGVKRDGVEINQSMWNLDNYRANPVVLWVHDFGGQHLPIGRSVVMVEGGKLIAEVNFDQEDEFARQVESKYRRGYLNAVSVSWENTELDGRVMHELLDISAVPVPGDPNALIQRQAAGLRSLQRDIDQVLGATSPEDEPPIYEDDSLLSLSRMVADEVALRMGSRAGAVLSQRNKDDLEQAMALIRGVIDRGVKPDQPLPDEEPMPEEKPQRAAAAEPQADDMAAMLSLKQMFDSFKL